MPEDIYPQHQPGFIQSCKVQAIHIFGDSHILQVDGGAVGSVIGKKLPTISAGLYFISNHMVSHKKQNLHVPHVSLHSKRKAAPNLRIFRAGIWIF